MAGNLAGNYALGANINATATSGWNSGDGFSPIGNITTNFTGAFDGLGHTISGLTIKRPLTNYVGLFGYIGSGAKVSNVGMAGGSVNGRNFVGGLAGYNKGPVTNSYATGSVTGSGDYVGGLVGCKYSGTITDSYATGNVEGNSDVGGLVGYNKGRVTNAYATGNVTGIGDYVGGLAGYNNGTIADSYASGSVNGGPAI